MHCLPSASACIDALRRVRALRSQIASELAGAAVHTQADTDLADCVECMRSWLDDGDTAMAGALRHAEIEVSAAAENFEERRIVPHAIAAE